MQVSPSEHPRRADRLRRQNTNHISTDAEHSSMPVANGQISGSSVQVTPAVPGFRDSDDIARSRSVHMIHSQQTPNSYTDLPIKSSQRNRRINPLLPENEKHNGLLNQLHFDTSTNQNPGTIHFNSSDEQCHRSSTPQISRHSVEGRPIARIIPSSASSQPPHKYPANRDEARISPRFDAGRRGWQPNTIERKQHEPNTSSVETTVEYEPQRVPQWLSISIVCVMLLCLGFIAAYAMLGAYLTQQREAREIAHQKLLSSYPLEYREWIEQYAFENNLHPAFVAGIILNESSFQPLAESNVGARGLMQLMEDTAEWIANKIDEPNFSFNRMYDPECNIRFGCWYLNYLSKLFGGDPVCVASAYHAGQGTVSNWLQNGIIVVGAGNNAIELMPDGPTKTYAGRVTKAYAIYDALYYHSFNSSDPESDTDTMGTRR